MNKNISDNVSSQFDIDNIDDYDIRRAQIKNERMIKRKQRRRKKIFIGSSCVLLVLGISIAIFAKYIQDYSATSSVPNNVIADFYMDVVVQKGDDNNYVQLEQEIDLQEINPGEQQGFTFIVRNGTKKDNSFLISDVDVEYTIQIIHTQNLPLNYSLYEYVGNGNGDFGTNNSYKLITQNSDNGYSRYPQNVTNRYENVGIYEKYTKGYYNKNQLLIDTSESLQPFFLKRDRKYLLNSESITMRKYYLLIDWLVDGNPQYDRNVSYSNEVDLVYVVVKGTQAD